MDTHFFDQAKFRRLDEHALSVNVRWFIEKKNATQHLQQLT